MLQNHNQKMAVVTVTAQVTQCVEMAMWGQQLGDESMSKLELQKNAKDGGGLVCCSMTI